MPTEYDGNPTSAQSPALSPGDAVAVKMNLPVDGDLKNVSSIYQALKVAADWIAFLRNFKATFAHTSGSGWHALTLGNFRILIESFNLDSTSTEPISTGHAHGATFATRLVSIPTRDNDQPLTMSVAYNTATSMIVHPRYDSVTGDAPYPVTIVTIGLVA
jgi:hypothetical protein